MIPGIAVVGGESGDSGYIFIKTAEGIPGNHGETVQVSGGILTSEEVASREAIICSGSNPVMQLKRVVNNDFFAEDLRAEFGYSTSTFGGLMPMSGARLMTYTNVPIIIKTDFANNVASKSAIFNTTGNLLLRAFIDNNADTLQVSGSAGISGNLSSFNIRRGTGAPESVVTGSIGALYQRVDGGAGTTLYIKESGTGTTGWIAVATPALFTTRVETAAVSAGLQLTKAAVTTVAAISAGLTPFTTTAAVSAGLQLTKAAVTTVAAISAGLTPLTTTAAVSAGILVTTAAISAGFAAPSYITLATSSLLSNERTLAVANGLTLTDAGANAAVTIGMTASGVSIGTYGSSTLVPVITVDAQGRITNATTVAVASSSGGSSLTGGIARQAAIWSSTSAISASSVISENPQNGKLQISGSVVISGGTSLADFPLEIHHEWDTTIYEGVAGPTMLLSTPDGPQKMQIGVSNVVGRSGGTINVIENGVTLESVLRLQHTNGRVVIGELGDDADNQLQVKGSAIFNAATGRIKIDEAYGAGIFHICDADGFLKLEVLGRNISGIAEISSHGSPLSINVTGNNVLLGTVSDDTINKLQVTGTAKVDGLDVNNGVLKNHISNMIDESASLVLLDKDVHAGNVILLSYSSGALGIEVPNDLPVGFTCLAVQVSAGPVTVAAGSGATVLNRQGHTTFAGQYSTASFVCIANSGGSSAVVVFSGDTSP